MPRQGKASLEGRGRGVTSYGARNRYRCAAAACAVPSQRSRRRVARVPAGRVLLRRWSTATAVSLPDANQEASALALGLEGLPPMESGCEANAQPSQPRPGADRSAVLLVDGHQTGSVVNMVPACVYSINCLLQAARQRFCRLCLSKCPLDPHRLHRHGLTAQLAVTTALSIRVAACDDIAVD